MRPGSRAVIVSIACIQVIVNEVANDQSDVTVVEPLLFGLGNTFPVGAFRIDINAGSLTNYASTMLFLLRIHTAAHRLGNRLAIVLMSCTGEQSSGFSIDFLDRSHRAEILTPRFATIEVANGNGCYDSRNEE